MTSRHIKSLLNIDGNELYIEFRQQHADRPTLVFLHDSLGCVQLWRDFPDKLAAATHCNVLAYDRLGYGKSAPMSSHDRPSYYLELEADVLNRLLATLELDNTILFGHSDGGSIALISASKCPERVRALICEAAHVFVEEVTLKGIREAMDAYQTTNLPERLQKYHAHKVETLFRAWTETWTRSDYKDWNIEHFLPAITCPLLFIQGAADEYGTLEQVERTITQVSGEAEKFILPDVGHTPHKEKPEQVLEKSIQFITQVSNN